jgi:hypothetical protein
MPKSASSGERDPKDVPPRLPPAQTRERRVQQLVSLAENLIEERLRLGTASPTETVAVMRLQSELEQANIARVREHTEYLRAQKEKAQSETVREELFTKAMEHMGRYSKGLNSDPSL